MNNKLKIKISKVYLFLKENNISFIDITNSDLITLIKTISKRNLILKKDLTSKVSFCEKDTITFNKEQISLGLFFHELTHYFLNTKSINLENYKTSGTIRQRLILYWLSDEELQAQAVGKYFSNEDNAINFIKQNPQLKDSDIISAIAEYGNLEGDVKNNKIVLKRLSDDFKKSNNKSVRNFLEETFKKSSIRKYLIDEVYNFYLQFSITESEKPTMETKASSVLKLCYKEAIPVSWHSNNRFFGYLKAAAKKFNLGNAKDIEISKNISMQKFGPIDSSFGKKYLLLITRETGSSKKGYITHYLLTNSENTTLKQVGQDYDLDGVRFMRIPDDYVKIEHVLALAKGLAKYSLRSSAIIETHEERASKMITQIKEMWESVILTLEIVFMANTPGVIITGSPGMGKTYTIMQVLKSLGFKKDEDFAYYQGSKITLTGFYNILYENSDRIIIFDDSDSVFNSTDGINMMKAALDSTSDRTVSYESPAVDAMGLPRSFQFTGKLVFLSNLPMSQIDSALKSRSVVQSLHMSRDQKMADMETKYLAMKKNFDLTDDEAKEVYTYLKEFVKKNPNKPENLDLRTLLKLYDIRVGIKQRGQRVGDNSEKQFELFSKLAQQQLTQS